MNENKILIELEIPLIERSYDLYIPINKKVGTVKRLIEKALEEITENTYIPREDTNLYSKESALPYDVNDTVRDTDLKNGSRVILL